MSHIKFLSRIKNIATDTKKLEFGAHLHKRHSCIKFKILQVEGKKIAIKTTQGKCLNKNYITQRALIQRTKELFAPFCPGYIIQVHASVFVPHPLYSVTPKWLQMQMKAKGVKVKDLVELTGLEKSNISAWINGTRGMSNVARTMFYAYLK